MARKIKHKRTFRIKDGNIQEPYRFAEELVTRKDIDRETAFEALLVFEALMQEIVDWGLDEDTDLDITGQDKLGDLSIKIGFEGKVFIPNADGSNSIEDKLLEAHDDKLDYSYQAGYNIINISVSRSYRTSLFACLVATLVAILVYIPLHNMLDEQTRADVLTNYILPFEKLFTNAMLMVGAPMTFFSLLKNLTDTYVVSQRGSGLMRLSLKTLATSVFAIVLAFAAYSLMGIRASAISSGTALVGPMNRSFGEVVSSLVEPSIFTPFEAVLPVPLMVIALLATYALCSAGKHFDLLRQIMMACYTLFSRMLHVVIAALPVFCFFAIMDLMLDSGFDGIVGIILFCLLAHVGLLLLFASYAIRLRVRGIKVIPFIRHIIPLVRENIKIGSVINATPYNIRYCSRTYKMNRPMLERNMPVLAQINLDGNCFILMYFAIVFLIATGMGSSWVTLLGTAALVLLLSYGAPNQPGSILIGTLMIITYFNSTELLCATIYAEAFLGPAQNIVNVIGDVVAAAIEDKVEKDKQKEGEKA